MLGIDWKKDDSLCIEPYRRSCWSWNGAIEGGQAALQALACEGGIRECCCLSPRCKIHNPAAAGVSLWESRTAGRGRLDVWAAWYVAEGKAVGHPTEDGSYGAGAGWSRGPCNDKFYPAQKTRGTADAGLSKAICCLLPGHHGEQCKIWMRWACD